jgi:hypothetical protein
MGEWRCSSILSKRSALDNMFVTGSTRPAALSLWQSPQEAYVMEKRQAGPQNRSGRCRKVSAQLCQNSDSDSACNQSTITKTKKISVEATNWGPSWKQASRVTCKTQLLSCQGQHGNISLCIDFHSLAHVPQQKTAKINTHCIPASWYVLNSYNWIHICTTIFGLNGLTSRQGTYYGYRCMVAMHIDLQKSLVDIVTGNFK